MTDVYQVALDTLKAGAPGLSDQTKEVLAGIIARKAALTAREEAPGEGAGVKKACAVFQEAIDDFEADVADVLSEGSERADLWDREITVNIDTLKTVMSAALRARTSEPAREAVAWPDTCDGIEQPEFEAWAAKHRFDMHEHPLHYLFMDPRTDAARQGWKAGLEHAVARMKATHPAPATADKLKVAVEALERIADLKTAAPVAAARQALATLNEEGC